jgi:hypothetical protein
MMMAPEGLNSLAQGNATFFTCRLSAKLCCACNPPLSTAAVNRNGKQSQGVRAKKLDKS